MAAERVFSALYRLLAGILAAVSGGLFAVALFMTIVFRQEQENDYPDIVRLQPVFVLLLFATCLIILFILLKKAGLLRDGQPPKLSRKGVLIPEPWFACSILFVLVYCLFLICVIRGLPTNDARFCIEIAQTFLQGDYSAVQSGYLTVYPFQLSFCLFAEWLTRAFGAGNYLPYQLLNVASILLSLFFLYEITWELSQDIRACRAAAILGAGGFALFAYSTFIYNDIWSLGPLFGAFWMLIRYMERGGLFRGLAAVFLSAVSFFIKSNGAVALVAMCGLTAVCALKKLLSGNARLAAQLLLVTVLLALCPLGMRRAVNMHYASVSGGEVAKGVPAMAYVAMGMMENDGKFGWYNGDNVRYLSEAGGDSGKAAEAALAVVRERASEIGASPKAVVRFYGSKFLSQWADPTKGSLREQELTGRHQEGMRPVLAESLTFGRGFYVLQGLMHLSHLFLHFFAAVGFLMLCFGKRRLQESCALLPLFAFGGILFHELWEASGRYVLRYELAFLPFAALGMIRLFSLLPEKKK